MALPHSFPVMMILCLIFFLSYVDCVPAMDAGNNLLSVFEKWMEDHGRVYQSDAEKQLRFEVFKANFEFIESMRSQRGLTYTVALNQFADLTNSEFVAKYAKLVVPKKQKSSASNKYVNLTSVPTSIDWRSLGAVTPIKDQGQCG